MMMAFEDEISTAQETFAFDFETDPELITDDEDLNDVLALPLPLHGQLIIGHPDGGHLVEPVPIHVVPFCCHPY
ncbi:hypothetical protein Hanom_Chr02g00168381 [Helianthus anomalus]